MGGPGSGRTPKPTSLKVLEGNPGKRALPKGEPKPSKKEPVMPDWLSAEAEEKWCELVPQLREMDLLTQVDSDALATYCQAWSEFRRCTILLQECGSTYEGLHGPRSRPEVTIRDRAVEQMRQLAREFGLTPSARGRMVVPKSQQDKGDLDEMMVQSVRRGS